MLFSDIVEDNGKTIKENNLEKQHDLALGTLVEVKYSDHQTGANQGACKKIHARLFVVKQGRDCDGSILYWLSHKKPETQPRVRVWFPDENWGQNNDEQPIPGIVFNEERSRSLVDDWVGGFSKDSLTIVSEEEKKDILDW
jgi:hypothetical protein